MRSGCRSPLAGAAVVVLRRRCLGALAAVAAFGGAGAAQAVPLGAAASPHALWRATWSAFRARFIQDDGRVIDHDDAARSTSEGQAYAMFHALVADDRWTFERLRRWTRDNLCEGDLAKRLPAWAWGRRAGGDWGVLDDNNATDADLLIAWSLLEGAARWSQDAWRSDARALADALAGACLRTLPGLGSVLLPGRRGFETGARTRLNPSYAMLPLLNRLAVEWPDSAWRAVREGSERMLLWAAQPRQLARDWAEYDPGVPLRPLGDASGSYDAVRVYLWVALARNASLLSAYRGMAAQVDGGLRVPERIDAVDGRGQGNARAGFAAALLPYLSALGQPHTHKVLKLDVERHLLADPDLRRTPYYDASLLLFGLGASSADWPGLYRFNDRGELQTPAGAGARRLEP